VSVEERDQAMQALALHCDKHASSRISLDSTHDIFD
jgi:hypothetical protein